MIMGKNSYLEQIKSSDTKLYMEIMKYQVALLEHIESFQEKRLKDIRRNLKLFEENIKT